MAFIRPTQRWHSRTIQVPFVGLVYRPRSSDGSRIHVFEVPDKALDYLVKNNFARLVEETTVPDLIETPIASTPEECSLPSVEIEAPAEIVPDLIVEETEDLSEDSLEPNETSFDPSQLKSICSFINSRTKAQLLEIRGIGSAAATAIMKAKPIGVEEVLSVLRENQILAIAEAVNNA